MRRTILVLFLVAGCGGSKQLARESTAPPMAAGEAAGEQRPGLGTEWGETRSSHVGQTSFARASDRPWSVLEVFYNDGDGVRAQVEWRGGPGLGPMTFRQDGVTVWLQDEWGRTLPGVYANGRPYVIGEHGQRYVIAVRNDTGVRHEAVVTVDGLDVVDGRSGDLYKRGYVFSSWEQNTIRGWRKSMKDIAAFYFTSLGDSYAGRTGRPDNVGVIGVALFQRKRAEPPPMPYSQAPAAPDAPWRERADAANESKKQLGSASRAEPPAKAEAPLGTGHGRREHAPTRYVDFQRRTADPVETIAIYYDSYRNLVAQGVISSYSGRRDPNPWPTSFVPDP